MEMFRLLLISVLVVTMPFCSIAAMEQSQHDTAEKSAEDIREMPEPAKLFLGYVSNALMTDDYNMPDIALANLRYAKQDLKVLEQDSPGFAGGMVRVGRLDFVMPPAGKSQRQPRYALFPFEGVRFAVQIPELEGENQRNLAISPRDARVILLRTQWRMAQIKADLEDAITALSGKHSVEAGIALQKILGQDITGMETKAENPDALLVVYNQLMLANHLLMAKDYAYCRLALGHAQQAIKAYAASKSVQYDKRAVALKNEMQAEIVELKKNNPLFAKKVREKMNHWIDTIKSLIKSHTHTES